LLAAWHADAFIAFFEASTPLDVPSSRRAAQTAERIRKQLG
jgi:hypothetical protein